MAAACMLAIAGCHKEVEPTPGTDPGTDPGETPVTPPGPDPVEIDFGLLTGDFCMSVGRQIDIAPFIRVKNLEDLEITSSAPVVVEVTSDMKFIAKQAGVATIHVKAGDADFAFDIEVENSALMYIQNVFTVTGRGTVVTGNLSCGTLKTNDAIKVFNLGARSNFAGIITGLEVNKTVVDEVTPESGSIGALLRGVTKDMVSVGAALVTPDSKANVYTNELTLAVTNIEEGKTLAEGQEIALVIGEAQFNATIKSVTKFEEGAVVSLIDVQLGSQRAVAFVGEECTVRANGKNMATMAILSMTECPTDDQFDLNLAKKELILAPGQTISLRPYLITENIDIDAIEVNSSDPSVLTVDKESWSLTTVAAGKADITLSFLDLSATMKVEVENTFVASITDAFAITGKGIVLTSLPLSGTLNVNDPVYVLNYKTGYNHYDTQIVGIEKARKEVTSISAGDGEAGLLLPSVFTDRLAFARGGIVMSKDTKRVQPTTSFTGTISLKSKEDGGRISPVMVNYMPQYSVGSGAIKVKLTDLGGEEMLSPGETYYGCSFEVQNGDLLLSYIGQELTYATDGITITVTDVTPVTVSYTTPAAASLSMYTTSGTIAVGDKLNLMNFIVSENVDFSKVTVTSSATDVATATMSSDYKSIEVAALKAGTTTVTVTSGSLSASIAFTVEDSFCMAIKDVYTISGRGTVAAGTSIQTGTINTGDQVDIDPTSTTADASALEGIVVTGIEVSRTVVDKASYGETAGLLLRGLTKDQLSAGYVIHTPGSKRNVIATKFAANVRVLTQEEGGSDSTVLTPGTEYTINLNEAQFTAKISASSPSLSSGQQGIVTVELAEGTQASLSLGKAVVFRSGTNTVAEASVIGLN